VGPVGEAVAGVEDDDAQPSGRSRPSGQRLVGPRPAELEQQRHRRTTPTDEGDVGPDPLHGPILAAVWCSRAGSRRDPQ
jgi:hypothetical protein